MKDLPTVLLVLPSRRDIQAMAELLAGAVNVVGEATSLKEAERALLRLHPRVVLAALKLAGESALSLPETVSDGTSTRFVYLGEDPSPEDYRSALQAGAADLLSLPVAPGEVLEAIRRAAGEGMGAEGCLVAVFSTKGGVGKTMIAANMATELVATRKSVILVDLDLEFGNLASFFGLLPKASIADIARRSGAISLADVREVAAPDEQIGIPILASPPSPDLAATVDGDARRQPGRNYVAEILQILRAAYDYVIVDTAPRFTEGVVTALEEASSVIVVASPDIPTLHTTARGLQVMTESLGLDPERITVVLNRANATIGLAPEDIAKLLGRPVTHRIPSDGDTAVRAANTGIPFVRRRGRTPLARALRLLTQDVAGQTGQKAVERRKRIALFGRR